MWAKKSNDSGDSGAWEMYTSEANIINKPITMYNTLSILFTYTN
jgi:hypothetical protein